MSKICLLDVEKLNSAGQNGKLRDSKPVQGLKVPNNSPIHNDYNENHREFKLQQTGED